MQYTISRHWGDGKKETEEVTESNKFGFPKDVTLEKTSGVLHHRKKPGTEKRPGKIPGDHSFRNSQ